MATHKYRVGDTFTLVRCPYEGIGDFGIPHQDFGKVFTITALASTNFHVPRYIAEVPSRRWHVYEDMMDNVNQQDGPW